MNWRLALRSCFWLLVPILVFNVVCAPHLPPAFQADVFWRDIPRWIAWPENVLRVVLFATVAFAPLEVTTAWHRRGLALFVIGTLGYFAAWGPLLAAPNSAWSTSLPGFLAPAITPAVWLTGLCLVAQRLVIPRLPYRAWMLAVVAAAFLGAHVSHAALVWSRL